MRTTEHFKNHLAVHCYVDGEEISKCPIEDPFHTTRIVIRPTFLEWLRLLWRREIEVRVKVRADGCAQGRWFQGADICEKCCRTRITGNARSPGYESHGMNICEECYYEKPIALKYAGQENVAS